ncbi:DUF2804 domain-containing protein [Litoribacillus peritrichatus]|uniref:DUF2804 domain-containing protein n=1 Tax=Litoribacillus peritrichatus TaxID=718191 RepID=A0ABP7MYH0_9GAMM
MTNLVSHSGAPRFGWLKEPVSEVNFQDYPLQNTMDNQVNGWRKNFKFNQFHFIGLLGPDFMAGIAIVNLKLVSNCFYYVWHKEHGLLVEESKLAPMGLGTNIGTSPDLGASRFLLPGTQCYFEQHNEVTRVRLKTKHVNAELTLTQNKGYQPLRVCSQAGYNGWVFTQKTAGLDCSGYLNVKDHNFELSKMDVLGSADWSCGFMRRETAWNWACLSGRDAEARQIGLNLASGVNETGITENGFWVDGTLHKLGPVRFSFNRHSPEEPWRVESDCDRVKLTFQPEGKRTEKVNVGVLASNFKQMFGYYSGSLVTDQGEEIQLKNQPGFAEDHYAKW